MEIVLLVLRLFFGLCHSCCSHARVFKRTLVHELTGSYSPIERYFFRRLFFDLLHSCGSHARVLRRTLVYEFPFSYSHIEWYLLPSLEE